MAKIRARWIVLNGLYDYFNKRNEHFSSGPQKRDKFPKKLIRNL